MFHQKTLKMDCYDGKGPQKMINEIFLHLTVRSNSRLPHYVVIKKMRRFDCIDWEIIAFEVEKKMFFWRHPNFGQL